MSSTKIEWLIDKRVEFTDDREGHWTRTTDFNYAQIFRYPYDGSRVTPDDALMLYLDDIEAVFRDGKREMIVLGSHPVTMMGGVKDLLGHWPRLTDQLTLRVLRPLELRIVGRDRYDQPADFPVWEWIGELSLQAVEGR
jgi:hypothetical protein